MRSLTGLVLEKIIKQYIHPAYLRHQRGYTGVRLENLLQKRNYQYHSSKIEKIGSKCSAGGLLEIVPLLMEKDDVVIKWVSLIHKMRDMLSHFDETVNLPAPLQLAHKIEEYI
jgi:hypothetical protein